MRPAIEPTAEVARRDCMSLSAITRRALLAEVRAAGVAIESSEGRHD
jgi:hypothetical protein